MEPIIFVILYLDFWWWSFSSNTLQEGNKQFLENLKKSNEQRQTSVGDLRTKFCFKTDEGIFFFFCDINSIEDLNFREHFQVKKAHILQKRSHQQQNQQTPPPPTSFGQSFNNFVDPEIIYRSIKLFQHVVLINI